MPRQAREKSQTGIYHLICRGINRTEIFREPEDKQRFLETLWYCRYKGGYEVYAYCLMSNHVHLLLRERSEPVGVSVKRISASYVLWYNQKYNRCGHLFQDRFKSEAIGDDIYFLTVLRYIHQNPVKACITNTADEYKWSSYDDYIGKGGGLTAIEFPLSLFAENRVEAIILFENYVRKRNEDHCLEYSDSKHVDDQELYRWLHKLGIHTRAGLKQLNRQQRNELLGVLREKTGVTVRQLARVTGFSKSLIGKIDVDK